MDSQQQVDISKLSEADKKELNQFLTSAAQKSQIQQTVHHLSDVCWKKCISGKISSGRLDSSEETCATNCVERWMDTNLSVLKHLEQLRGN
ncbi:Tim10/DDP family zinc finger-domain-containing protein [Aspergillus taichungensis]|uniref:Mitochondrial import inner membrane translocase subunit n=1 Tax=Aspergillus taichungensis TaxID=482145 RepID=A0A2J5HDK5_9EURO|nr:Tim10/DDP family zinc finger-domain-containing protein [Aspergillus taichungensis]